MGKIPDKLMAWLEPYNVVCQGCNEPMGCSDDNTTEYDYDAWTDVRTPGIFHHGCLTETDKLFKVEIHEESNRVIDVKAKNVEAAIDVVEQQYKNSDIVLDANDFQNHTIKVI